MTNMICSQPCATNRLQPTLVHFNILNDNAALSTDGSIMHCIKFTCNINVILYTINEKY